ncbi:hypothetical protein [Nocardia sp. NPDC050175]|uniref:hypothetical protein n=1 Tax=Nocardia sp. NPDC050175 TaxID=3364317 RepID=UPI0037A81707
MATQQLLTQAVPPAPPVTVASAPAPAVAPAMPPGPPSTTLDTAVPIIKPYSVAASGGNGILGAVLGVIRTSPAALPTGSGTLATTHNWVARVPAALGAVGQAIARIAIKSGTAVVPAPLTGSGLSTGTIDAQLPAAAAGSEGSVTAALSVITTADAIFGGEGSGSALTPVTTEGAGRGGLAVATAVIGKVVLLAAYTAAAGVAAAAAPGTFAPVEGLGALAATALTSAAVNQTNTGSLAIEYTPRSMPSTQYAAAGTLSVDVRSTFTPSSMKKNDTWYEMDTSWKTVSGWLPDLDGYPGSTVSNNNGLVVRSAKTGANLEAGIQLTGAGAFTSSTITLRLLVNNVSVVEISKSVGGEESVTVKLTNTRNVAAGNVITVQAKAQSTLNPAHVDLASFVRVT